MQKDRANFGGQKIDRSRAARLHLSAVVDDRPGETAANVVTRCIQTAGVQGRPGPKTLLSRAVMSR